MSDGRASLFLDIFPPYTNSVSGKITRKEYLRLYVWVHPRDKQERQHNAETLAVAEQERCQKEQYLLKEALYSDEEKEKLANIRGRYRVGAEHKGDFCKLMMTMMEEGWFEMCGGKSIRNK